MKFPNAELQATGGEITCSVFENALTGLKRSLFWSLTLEFAPTDNENTITMTCDWIPWKFRHWKEMDGATLSAKYGHDGIEGSFYVCEHDLMETVSLSIHHVRDHFFKLDMEMVVDYGGSEFSDPEPHMLVRGSAVVPFKGLYVEKEMSTILEQLIAEGEAIGIESR